MSDVRETEMGELLRFLRKPSSYSPRPASLRLIQTHISWVAIAPPCVYKVKKPVALGFADFSTVEKRRDACEAEVRFNQRLCQDIYDGVVPISRKGRSLVFGSGDMVVDYAVKMRYLAAEDFLDQRLGRDAVTRRDIRRIIEKLRTFYESQAASPEAAAWGRIEKLKLSTDENFVQLEPFAGTLLPQAALDALRFYTDRFFDCHAALFSRRRANGRILDCHGDLRLEHIHITSTSVNIFDCVEFNERLREIDVANDIAFLAMDFDYHGRRDLASYFIRQMARALHDRDLLPLIDFYKCYRACVRGKVAAIKSLEAEVPEAERRSAREEAARHFRLALGYAVTGSEPIVAVVMGRVATGKSTLAEALAAVLGWERVSSDIIRKELAEVAPFERGDATTRVRLYDEAMSERTYAALADRAIRRANKNESTILDATFGRKALRRSLREKLRRKKIRWIFIETQAAEETVRDRLRSREGATQEASDARLEDYAALSARYEAPNALEDAHHILIQSGPSSEMTLTAALTKLIRLQSCRAA